LTQIRLEKASWRELGSIWVAKRLPNGSPNNIEIDPTSVQKMIKDDLVATYPQETTPRGPKTASRGPQTLPRGSKIAPRGPQDSPKRPSERPKASQDAPAATIRPRGLTRWHLSAQ